MRLENALDILEASRSPDQRSAGELARHGPVDSGALRDSVGPDHAELIACGVLQESCRPLAGLCDRYGSGACFDHLGDHRRCVFDEQIEVRSDLRGLRFGNPLEGQLRWPVGAAGPVDRDVRPTSTVWTSHVAEELLPEGGQLMGVRAVDGDSDLHLWPRSCFGVGDWDRSGPGIPILGPGMRTSVQTQDLNDDFNVRVGDGRGRRRRQMLVVGQPPQQDVGIE
jgi:hypothetical protein